jgi:hypothetical protein
LNICVVRKAIGIFDKELELVSGDGGAFAFVVVVRFVSGVDGVFAKDPLLLLLLLLPAITLERFESDGEFEGTPFVSSLQLCTTRKVRIKLTLK